MIPTPRFWLLVALGIPVAGIAGALGAPSLFWGYNGLLLVMAIVTGKMLPPLGLQVRRTFDPVLSVRVRNRIELALETASPIPAKLRIRDEAPSGCKADGNERSIELKPGRETTIEYGIIPAERGTDYFRGTFVRAACPLGLVEREFRLQTQQPVRIYPNVLALREFDLLKQKGKLAQIGIRKSRIRGLGSEFESLREYADGDDFRKVDWKATGRRGKLIVRQYEQERSQSVILVVDIGRLMLAEADGIPKLDHVLDSLLMLAHAVTVAGDTVGLLVYSDVVHRYIPPRKGRGQLGAVIEAIHDLVAEPVESDPIGAFAYLSSKWKRRSLMVAFSDANDSDDALALATAIGPLARRHVSVVARVGDPKLRELVETPLDNLDALYRRGAALIVLEDRRGAKASLGAAHIHSLEAEPQDLSAALVSFYFEVKERSLL